MLRFIVFLSLVAATNASDKIVVTQELTATAPATAFTATAGLTLKITVTAAMASLKVEIPKAVIDMTGVNAAKATAITFAHATDGNSADFVVGSVTDADGTIVINHKDVATTADSKFAAGIVTMKIVSTAKLVAKTGCDGGIKVGGYSVTAASTLVGTENTLGIFTKAACLRCDVADKGTKDVLKTKACYCGPAGSLAVKSGSKKELCYHATKDMVCTKTPIKKDEAADDEYKCAEKKAAAAKKNNSQSISGVLVALFSTFAIVRLL